MKSDELRERLVQFALRTLRLCASLPNTPEGRLIRGQLVRCGTSPGAQYREACRARSPAEFISKMESCEQELDESDYWLLLLERSGMVSRAKLSRLEGECRELIRIFASSVNTAKKNKKANAG
jgi:four helix bundle protein